MGGVIPLILFVILGILRISVDGALAFFIGFELKRKNLLNKIKLTDITYLAFFSVSSIILRLLTKKFIDGTVCYNEVIAPLTHVILAACIMGTIKWAFSVMPEIMRLIASSSWVKHIDTISVYIYISHVFLIDGTILSMFKWKIPFVTIILMYSVFVMIISTLLWRVGDRLSKGIEKNILYLN